MKIYKKCPRQHIMLFMFCSNVCAMWINWSSSVGPVLFSFPRWSTVTRDSVGGKGQTLFTKLNMFIQDYLSKYEKNVTLGKKYTELCAKLIKTVTTKCYYTNGSINIKCSQYSICFNSCQLFVFQLAFFVH